MALPGTGDQAYSRRLNARPRRPACPGAVTIIAAIVILLVYQGYSLSIVGVASPWIAKSFGLDEAKLAELFAWMSLSAFGALILARLADRVGRRRIILSSLVLAPLCAGGAALARRPMSFALFEILISALLGGSGLIRDRPARRGVPCRAASAGTGVCGQRQCGGWRARLYRHPVLVAVGIFVAMAAGALRRGNCVGGPVGAYAAG